MARDTVELLSPLPLDRCRSLLDVQIDRPYMIFGSRPLIGWLSETTMRARLRIAYGNSFQTHLTATLTAEGGRTRVCCRFGLNPLVVVFMIIWFSFVVLAGGVMIVTAVHALAAEPRRMIPGVLMGIAIPIGMLVFGVGLVALGRYLARAERDVLLAFISDTLQVTRRAGVGRDASKPSSRYGAFSRGR